MSFKKFAMVALAGAALAMDMGGSMGDSGSGMESSAAVAPTVAETTEAAPTTATGTVDTTTPFTNSSSSSIITNDAYTRTGSGDDAMMSSASAMMTAEGTAASPVDPMSTSSMMDGASMDATATVDDMTTMSTSVISMDNMPMGTGGSHPMNASSTGSVPISGTDLSSGVSVGFAPPNSLASLDSQFIDPFVEQIVLIIASTMLGGLFVL
ncbi:hypothetical protein E8E14_010438 [Neopestalotiopsis sp. 37M]|nr:hypothetical protein E8E14_010438 [Neopestalotiopsis sp. 37M]